MRVKEITSARNPTFGIFLKIMKARGIRKYGMALLFGSKQVTEVLREFPERSLGLLLTDRHELPGTADPENVALYRLKGELFQQVDLFQTGQPILLVRVDPFVSWDDGSWPEGCTLCIPFQDPANVGSVLRSAAAFGVSRVVLLAEAAHPFLPRSVRAAGSALFRIPMEKGPSLYRLRISQAPLITLSPDGRDIGGYRFPNFFCLVPGLEGSGIPPRLKGETVLSIPMERGVESLNAALATGIALYLWKRALQAPEGQGRTSS